MGLLEAMLNGTMEDMKTRAYKMKRATLSDIVAHISTWLWKEKDFASGNIVALERQIMNCKWNIGELFVVISTDKSVFPAVSLDAGESFNANVMGDLLLEKPTDDKAGVGYILTVGHSAFFRLATQEEIDASEPKPEPESQPEPTPVPEPTKADDELGDIEDELGEAGMAERFGNDPVISEDGKAPDEDALQGRTCD